MSTRLLAGDCLEILPMIEADSISAVVTDPPYGLSKEPDMAEVLSHWLAGDTYRHGSAGFMGKSWDSFVPGPEYWREVYRVLSPGGYLVAFAGTRTADLMGTAIRLAGFERRDTLMWVYGSGFPKSLDVSKAIDKANGRLLEDRYALGRHIRERREGLGISRAEVNGWLGAAKKCEHYESSNPGFARVPTLADWAVLSERLGLDEAFLSLVERAEAEREVIGQYVAPEYDRPVNAPAGAGLPGGGSLGVWNHDITAPATDAARQWEGWGTALKPAWEPIILARKPLVGTVAQNVLAHGTGALNIGGCRIEGIKEIPGGKPRRATQGAAYGELGNDPGTGSGWNPNVGRWPANVVLSHEAGCREVGTKRVKTGTAVRRNGTQATWGTYGRFDTGVPDATYADADGTETVAAWECVPECAVRLLDEQSGERKSPRPYQYRGATDEPEGVYSKGLGYGGHDREYGDTGGASRFFLTVRPDRYCLLCDGIVEQKHGTMNETLPGDRSCDHVQNAGKTSDQSEASRSSAPLPALAEEQHGSADKSVCKITSAISAASRSESTPATSGPTVQSNAVDLRIGRIVQAVQSAASLCDSCATATARSLVAMRLGQDPASLPCLVSIREPRRRILSQSLALLAEIQPSTAITLTTASLKLWSGYVRDAIGSTINSGSDGQNTESDLTRFRYVSKASPSERGAFNDHPTVKPLALCSWLVKLVTPPGGVVLDPFCGSGSVLIAADRLGVDAIGIDADPHAIDIARRRLAEDAGPLFTSEAVS